jgi:hypothetical protein
MRTFLFSMLVLSVSTNSFAEAPPKASAESTDKPTSFWMEKKMEYTQDMLRGLATADFESIGENARQLRLLNKVEGFVRRRHVSYRSQLNIFERTCDEMILHADKENLAGVTLAFNQLTISCVSCHESLRAPQVNETANPKSESK